MDHEILAIVEALWHWHLYLHGKKFVMHMDHCPLMYFFAQPNLSLANYAGLKILLIFFLGVVFSTLRDLLTSFQMPSLDALIS